MVDKASIFIGHGLVLTCSRGFVYGKQIYFVSTRILALLASLLILARGFGEQILDETDGSFAQPGLERFLGG